MVWIVQWYYNLLLYQSLSSSLLCFMFTKYVQCACTLLSQNCTILLNLLFSFLQWESSQFHIIILLVDLQIMQFRKQLNMQPCWGQKRKWFLWLKIEDFLRTYHYFQHFIPDNCFDGDNCSVLIRYFHYCCLSKIIIIADSPVCRQLR